MNIYTIFCVFLVEAWFAWLKSKIVLSLCDKKCETKEIFLQLKLKFDNCFGLVFILPSPQPVVRIRINKIHKEKQETNNKELF